MRIELAVTFIALSLLACGGDSPTPKAGPAGLVITNPGEGEPNVEPLFPLRVGFRWHGPEGVSAITRVSDRHGRPLLIQQSTGRADAISDGRALADMGRQELFWAVEDGALVLHAVGSNEPLPEPVVVVPAEVRAGMTWSSGTSRGEVLDVRMSDTLFGRRRVWSLRVIMQDQIGQTDHTFELIEGRGPTGARWSMVPLEDTTPALSALPERTPMTRIGSAKPDFSALSADGMSAVEDPAQPGTWLVGLGGFQPWVEVGIFDTAMYRDRRFCLTANAATFTQWRLDDSGQLPRDYTPRGCEDAAGRVHLASGAYARVPMEGDGSARTRYKWVPPCRPGQLDCEHVPASYVRPTTGAFLGLDGVAYGLGTLLREVGAYPLHLPGDGDARPAWQRAQMSLRAPTDTHFRAGLVLPFSETSQLTRTVVLAPEDEGGFDVVFHHAHWVGAMHGQHRTPHLPGIGADERWVFVDPRRAWPDLDAMTTLLRPDNTRELYQTSEDGLVWRVEYARGADGDGLVRRFVAALALEDGHRLVGVLPGEDGTLLALTETGHAFAQRSGPFELTLESAEQHLYRVELPPTGEPVAPALWEGLDVARDGRDVRLCAPLGQTLPHEGWTLGGEAARVIVAGPCILLVRGLERGPNDPLVPSDSASYEVRGTLPGLGAVVIGLDFAAFEDPILDEVGSTRDGGASSTAQRLWPGHVMRAQAYPTLETGGELVSNDQYAFQRDEACVAAPCTGTVTRFDWDGDEVMRHEVTHAPGEGYLTVLYEDLVLWVREDDGAPADVLHPDGSQTEARPGGPGDPLYDLDRRCAMTTLTEDPVNSVWVCDEPDGTRLVSELIGPIGPLDPIGPTMPPAEEHDRLDLVWKVEGPWLRRLDLIDLHMQRVPIPGAESGGPWVARRSARASDGAVYLLLEEAEGEQPAWLVLRVDRVDLGLHFVARGRADSPEQVARLGVDAQVLVLFDEDGRVRVRIPRDTEPACSGATCGCGFGRVDEAGACSTERVKEETVSHCEEVAPLADPEHWVRIDPDRTAVSDGPEEPFWSHCAGLFGMAHAPPVISPTSVMSTDCVPYDGPFVGDIEGLGTSAIGTLVPVLRGAFELDFSGSLEFELVLASLDRFDRDRRYLDGCGPRAETTLSFSKGLSPSDPVIITTPDETVPVHVLPNAPLRIQRREDGVLTFGFVESGGYTPRWASSSGHAQPLAVVVSGMVKVLRMAIEGKSGACLPSCDGRDCGGDGCGGLCGACGANASCERGLCECDAGFTGDGQVCALRIGLVESGPAPSCGAALMANDPSTEALYWIDLDGPGGEAAFQALCSPPEGWTRPPNLFTLGSGVRLGASCEAGGEGTTLSSGGHAILYGPAVAAGEEIFVTHRTLVGGFELDVMLRAVTGDQRVGLHLDELAAFDAVTLAWLGAAPICGLTTTRRVSLWRTEGALSVQVGAGAPVVVASDLATINGRLRLETAATGNLRLMRIDSPGGILHDFGPYPGPVRAVGSATAGPGEVRIQSARCHGAP